MNEAQKYAYEAQRPVRGSGPATRFVASEGYKRIVNPSGRGTRWSSGPVDIKAARWTGGGCEPARCRPCRPAGARR